jgi:hypothetical protein
MKKCAALAFVLICAPVLASCGNSKDAATIYVITPAQKASRFTRDLATIADRHGLSSDLGKSTGSGTQVYHVIQSDGRWLWLWGTNVPIDPYADPTLCGHYAEGHPDPGQYVVTIDHGLGRIGLNRMLTMIAPGEPGALMLEISKELKAEGYDVRQKPMVCSPLSKEQAPSGLH